MVVDGDVETVVVLDGALDDDAPALADGVHTEFEARTLAIVGGLMTVGVVGIEKIIRNIPIL